ncbi:pantoate--beta-alanine ligase [Candidatus Micrarchaeota archaeon]|nr:pantoate--beta-alanine ligase [Candidatus Micrarchaeota archaeon]
MKTFRSSAQMRAWSATRVQSGKRIGFVPTMGFLHEGHLALVRRARKENDVVIVSIFVNPTQFGPKEDYSKYPRDLKKDLALLKKEKVDAVFVPSVADMYPLGVKAGNAVPIKAGAVSKPLEGAFRPGHFDGVCTVVKKLFDIVRPQATYFGQKDFQQTLVVKDMVARLRLPVRVIVCPTVREADGLAMSSRNVYLSPSERAFAPVLYQTILQAKNAFLKGEGAKSVEDTAKAVLAIAGFKVQYFSIADAETLASFVADKMPKAARKTAKPGRKWGVIAVAAYLGKTRLIDNVAFVFDRR